MGAHGRAKMFTATISRRCLRRGVGNALGERVRRRAITARGGFNIWDSILDLLTSLMAQPFVVSYAGGFVSKAGTGFSGCSPLGLAHIWTLEEKGFPLAFA